MLLTLIQEMLNSNLDNKRDFPDWGFSWFSSVPPGKFLGQYLDYTPNFCFSHSLQIHDSVIILVLSTDIIVEWSIAEGTPSVYRLEE
jgi:hypothetical protein